MDGKEEEERIFARRGLGPYLAPTAMALAFQGGFAIAVMVLDRANRALPSNALYVVAVEALVGAAFLAGLGIRALTASRRIARALRAPLESELPPAWPGPELAWSSLVQASRDEANRAIASRDAGAKAEMDDFIASVHALKTPVTALSLMVQRSMAEGLPLPVDEVGLEAEELTRILDLALGRLRLGDFEIGSRITRIDATAAARACVKRHRRVFIARGIAVDVRGDASVETDAYWLSFILDQLVSNAAKYASSRVGIVIGAEGRLASVSIEDDGPGFDAEDLLRAFGKSASGSAGSASGAAGPASSGYGLYLASEAAKRLGLVLELGSRGGSQARLSLPLSVLPFDELSRP